MGAGYGALTQFSKGEYAGANNRQDDVAVIAGSGTPLRVDDHGGQATPTPLVGSATGVIGSRADSDWFVVAHACAGHARPSSATPAPRGPDLDIQLTVTRAAGRRAPSSTRRPAAAARSCPPASARRTPRAWPAGSYLIGVDGVGARDAAHDRVLRLRQPRRLPAHRRVALRSTRSLPDGPAAVTTSVTSTTVDPALAAAAVGRRLRRHGVRRRAGRRPSSRSARTARSQTFTGLTPGDDVRASRCWPAPRSATAPSVSPLGPHHGDQAGRAPHRHRRRPAAVAAPSPPRPAGPRRRAPGAPASPATRCSPGASAPRGRPSRPGPSAPARTPAGWSCGSRPAATASRSGP